MDLVIALSSNIYLKLVEDKDLKTLDEITTKYKSEDDLINSKEYHKKIENFYSDYRYYINKMDKREKNPGKVMIYTNNRDIYNINVLYKKNKNKMNTKRLIDAIIKSFKEYIDVDLLLKVAKNCNFFLDSKYNYRIKGLGKIKSILYNSNSIDEYITKNYNKLISIIKVELLKGYNKETKEVSEKTYNYTRFIDSYLENRGIMTLKPAEKLQVNEKKVKSIEKITVNKTLPTELIGKGTSYLIEFLEEEYDKDDITYDEDEYIMDIDDFSFEEKDDEDTWFK